MTTLTINKIKQAFGSQLTITEDRITIELTDGRTISAPISWYPRLQNATMQEKEKWRWIGNGTGIHWQDLDEDISIENILLGQPSMESQESLKKWLENRA